MNSMLIEKKNKIKDLFEACMKTLYVTCLNDNAKYYLWDFKKLVGK